MVISQTPLRVSFFGGGTDIPVFYKETEGSVLSVTINKYIYVAIKKALGKSYYINYYNREKVDKIDDIKHDLIRECIKLLGIEDVLDITVLSDVSVHGTGLGSSSALTVGTLNALLGYKGKSEKPEKLAQMACEVEINVLKHPIGKQDQYASSYGGLNIFRFYQDETVNAEKIDLPREELTRLFANLFLVNTKISRKADEVLAKQIQNINSNKDFLKTMSKMPDRGKHYLETLQFDEFGSFLDEAWQLKKMLSNYVTNSAIDAVYGSGIKAGAAGGKLLGAGQGGFVLFYVPADCHKNFITAMQHDYKILPIEYEELGTRIICSDSSLIQRLKSL